MKIKRSALSLLLSLAMVLSFMPALSFTAFADDSVDRGKPTSFVITPAGSYTAYACIENGYKDSENSWVETSGWFHNYYEPGLNVGDEALVTYENLSEPVSYKGETRTLYDEDGEEYEEVVFVNENDDKDVLQTSNLWKNEQSYDNQFTGGTNELFRVCLRDGDDENENKVYSNDLSAYLTPFEIKEDTISAGETKELNSKNPGDYVRFTFVPAVSGNYCFRSKGIRDPLGGVFDADMEPIQNMDDYDDYTFNFAISFYGEQGKTYYLLAGLLEEDTGAFSVDLITGERDPYEEVVVEGVTYHLIDGASDAMVWEASSNLRGKVTIPSSVVLADGNSYKITSIDYQAFDKCRLVTEVVIPDSITEIQTDAFTNTGIKEISIPSSVTTIGAHAIGYDSTTDSETGKRTYTKVPGFVIDAPAGSIAAQYAAANGITVVDRVAERAAAEKAAAEKAAADKAAADKAAADKAAADKAAAEKAAADEAKAMTVKTVTVNSATVNAAAIDKAVKANGGSEKYVTKIILGNKVKKISSGAFKKYTKAKTIVVKSKKLTKASVKGSLKGSKVTAVQVKAGSKAQNKQYVKKYKTFFTKANAGKKATVK